jgi:hypothetical protein
MVHECMLGCIDGDPVGVVGHGGADGRRGYVDTIRAAGIDGRAPDATRG